MANEAIDYAARVAKGVALLDDKMPGWDDQIDLGALDIANGSWCVTAQLSGVNHFETGAAQLGLTLGASGTYTEHGFNAESGCDCCSTEEARGRLPEGYDQDAAYETLNRLWRGVIESRRAQADLAG